MSQINQKSFEQQLPLKNLFDLTKWFCRSEGNCCPLTTSPCIIQGTSEYRKVDRSYQVRTAAKVKGTFLSEGSDVFVITPNRRIFFFPETENLIFFWLKTAQILREFESLKGLQGQEGCISMARTVLKITKIQIIKFRRVKCLSVWRYDKSISTF